MFLRNNRSLKTGRTYLSIVRGFRDAEGKNRHKTIRKVGYLDILEKEYDDPITYFSQIAKQITAEEKEENKVVIVSISHQDSLPVGTDNRKNFGHVAFSHLYHKLSAFIVNFGTNYSFVRCRFFLG